MEQAPVTILIFNPYGKVPWQEKSISDQIMDTVDVQSIGAAIQNMILAAQSLGLGSCGSAMCSRLTRRSADG